MTQGWKFVGSPLLWVDGAQVVDDRSWHFSLATELGDIEGDLRLEPYRLGSKLPRRDRSDRSQAGHPELGDSAAVARARSVVW